MDLSKIREKLDAISKKNSGGGNNLWKPEPGKQVIRIVPYMFDRDWPFRELLFYYNLDKKVTISPVSFNQPDPIQEYADKLKSTGDKEDWLLARKIEPKLRIHVPILVRGKEEEGIKFWGFGNQIYEELLKIMDDPDYGDITDLKTGRDITVEYEKASGTDAFPKTTIRIKPSISPATTSKEVAELIKQMPSVEEIWKIPTYQELETMFAKFLNGGESEEEEQEDEDTPAVKSSLNSNASELNDLPSDFYEDKKPNISKSNAKPKNEDIDILSDIDAAFDDMFN